MNEFMELFLHLRIVIAPTAFYTLTNLISWSLTGHLFELKISDEPLYGNIIYI